MKGLLLFHLVLIPLVLAKIKTGCVKIKHIRDGIYLTSPAENDANTRRVSIKGGEAERWEITAIGGDQYTIKNKELNQFLFTSDATYSSNYHVYLWIPKIGVTAEKWTIEKAGNGLTIRNVLRPSCLFVGSSSWVYAKMGTTCKGKQFEWSFESC
uniref:Putative 15.3 kDa basic salivary protein n=1 Tax=Culex tarsalis TaxID=7177 RepID=A0A1Q3FII7_CULTA